MIESQFLQNWLSQSLQALLSKACSDYLTLSCHNQTRKAEIIIRIFLYFSFVSTICLLLEMLFFCQLADLLSSFGENMTNKMRIAMSSEWFVRSPGISSSKIERDINNLPYIPSLVLVELLYDSCRSVVVALESNYGNFWHQYLEYLFDFQLPKPLMQIGSASEVLNHKKK